MEPTEAFNWLVGQEWWKGVTTLVTGLAVIAAITPNQYDNLVLKWLRFAIDVAAFNWGNAKNEKKKED